MHHRKSSALLKKLLILAAFIILPLQVASAATNPMERGALDAGLAEAQTLVKAGKMQDAYTLYFALLREDPDNDAVLLGLARTAIASGHPNQAIMAYEMLIAKHPEATWLYKEIAQAYMAIGDKETAAEYLQKDTTLSDAEKSELAGILSKRYDRFQMHSRLRTGVLYDSNANQGPASNQIKLGNWMVNIGDSKAVETSGIYLGGQIDMSYRIKPNGSWWAVGDFNFYGRGNFENKLDKLDKQYSQWYKVGAGVRRVSARDFFDIRIKMEAFDYGFYNTVYSIGPEIIYARTVNPSLQLVSMFNVVKRDYVRNSAYHGTYGSIGQYARRFFGKQSNEFMFGGSYSFGRARNTTYSYDGWNILALWRFKPVARFEISPSISYGTDYYKGKATFLDKNLRHDKRLSLGLNMTYQVTKTMSIEGSYQYFHNGSNTELHDYDRHLITAGCAWNF